MAKPMTQLTSGEMVAISSALLEPSKQQLIEGDPLLAAFGTHFDQAKRVLVEAMQRQEQTLSAQERQQIRALLRELDDAYDFNARALYHLLDKLAYAFPEHREDLTYASSVIFRDGLRLITASAMHEAGEAERMAAEIGRDERVRRVLDLSVLGTKLGAFFEHVVKYGLQMKDVAARLSVDSKTQDTAATEIDGRQRWMYTATTFLRAVRMSALSANDQATLYQLFEQPLP